MPCDDNAIVWPSIPPESASRWEATCCFADFLDMYLVEPTFAGRSRQPMMTSAARSEWRLLRRIPRSERRSKGVNLWYSAHALMGNRERVPPNGRSRSRCSTSKTVHGPATSARTTRRAGYAISRSTALSGSDSDSERVAFEERREAERRLSNGAT